MRILVVAAGNRRPTWVDDGYSDYARRLRGSCTLELVEIPLGRRSKSGSSNKAQKEETARMLCAVPPAAHVVALTVEGRSRSTEQLAQRLQHWMTLGIPVVLLVGGADGRVRVACCGDMAVVAADVSARPRASDSRGEPVSQLVVAERPPLPPQLIPSLRDVECCDCSWFPHIIH